jgi:hypothetical protein
MRTIQSLLLVIALLPVACVVSGCGDSGPTVIQPTQQFEPTAEEAAAAAEANAAREEAPQ